MLVAGGYGRVQAVRDGGRASVMAVMTRRTQYVLPSLTEVNALLPVHYTAQDKEPPGSFIDRKT